jgi:hypothetical protein
MGHDRWVAYYCSPERGGANAKFEAEREYCFALYEATQPILKKLPQADQDFYGLARSYFADLAKVAFTTGIELTNTPSKWEFPIMQSSTYVNEAIYLLAAKKSVGKSTELKKLNTLVDRFEATVRAEIPNRLDEAKRLRMITTQTLRDFEKRSSREKAIAIDTCVKMTSLALSKP